MAKRVRTIDNFAPIGLVNAALSEWPRPDWRHWHSYTGENSVKRASKDAYRLPAACRMLVERMAVLDMPDECFPDLELHGAGMHEIPDGGHLSRHLDGAVHPQTGWKRVVNAVLFLNDNYSGGELCFDDSQVIPEKNRLAIFETSEDSWHWVNRVEGGSRKTLSLFWWSMSEVDSNRTSAEFSDEN